MNILVSACLLGLNCRYDGTGVLNEDLKLVMKDHHLIPFCPEIYGGLATPRTPAERVGDKVMTKTGEDVTAAYVRGAKEAVRLARLYGCQLAILKDRSPSCGRGVIYDGTFSKTKVPGNGVLAQVLLEQGMDVYLESEIHDHLLQKIGIF